MRAKRTPASHRPGIVALRDIRMYHRHTERLFQKSPLQRDVREIAETPQHSLYFRAGQEKDLRHTTEAILVEMFEGVQRVAIHTKGPTIYPKDI